MMLRLFINSLHDIVELRLQKYLWLAFCISIGIFLIIFFGIIALIDIISAANIGWFTSTVKFLGFFASFALTLIFFPTTVTAITNFYLEDIAYAVENKHYSPKLEINKQSLISSLTTSVKFFCILVALNIAILPFLLVLPVFPFVYFTINGYLHGLELFKIIANRQFCAKDVDIIIRSKRIQIFAAGVIIVLVQTVPLINLFAPVVGAVTMVHLFHCWKADHSVRLS
ncbi:MAG: hypothetical protein CFH06_01779 [Alphaproteobacteria bacterium MarineAlpha3_Bin5]|nr:hypothetical protein [Magnetovibrio sp.]PPR76234.1 MAG: hypothetical protein CFH06_01779 [Alphaproteobacteria bacterium MarineAlpha3_Bin5]